MISKRLTNKFVKRLMLVVSLVNRCQYCSWAHTKSALRVGITEDEIDDIISFQFKNVPKKEKLALVFAQHYADTDGNPSLESMKSLIRFYGKQKSRDIIHVLQIIMMANYLGNTLDAFENRITNGHSSPNSFCFELVVYFLAGGPILRKFMSKQNIMQIP